MRVGDHVTAGWPGTQCHSCVYLLHRQVPAEAVSGVRGAANECLVRVGGAGWVGGVTVDGN